MGRDSRLDDVFIIVVKRHIGIRMDEDVADIEIKEAVDLNVVQSAEGHYFILAFIRCYRIEIIPSPGVIMEPVVIAGNSEVGSGAGKYQVSDAAAIGIGVFIKIGILVHVIDQRGRAIEFKGML